MKIKTSHRLLLLALLLVLDVCVALGFTEDKRVHFTTDNGLPSNETYFVHEDKKGYIWIGTDRGLCRYDGYGFTVFTTSNSKITDNTIFKVYEAPTGELWFTCYNGTIFIYNLVKQEFRPFEHNDLLQKEQQGWIKEIIFDRHIYHIFFTHEYKKYLSYKPSTSKVSVVDFGQLVLNGKPYNTYEGQWILADLGPYKVAMINCKYCPTQFRSLGYDVIRVMKNDEMYWWYADNLLVGSNRQGTLNYWNLKNYVNYLYLSEDDTFYACTTKGLYQVDSRNGVTTVIFKNHNVSGVQKTINKSLWITTLDDGVYLLYQPERIKGIWKINDQSITCMLPYKNELFFGNQREEIYHFDLSLAQLLLTKVSDIPNQIPISSITYSPHHKKILATGLVEIICKDGFYSKFNIHNSVSVLKKIIQTAEGVYVGIPYVPGYVTISEKDGWRFHNTIKEQISDIAIDSSGKVILLGVNNAWEIGDSILKIFSAPNRLCEVAIDRYGRKVISQRNDTIVIIDSYGKSIAKYKMSNGMPNTIYLENDSVLWVGTNKGLEVVHIDKDITKSKVLYSINQDDGLPSNNINAIAVWKSKLCLGTNKGLYLIDKSSLQINSGVPKLNLEQVNVSNYSSNGLYKDVFKSNQNDFKFKYVGISFNRPSDGFYKYRLVKDSDSTIDYSYTNDVSIEFLNLSAGDYKFELSCRNKHNEWSQPVYYAFTVKPHFIQTWWFKGAISTFSFFALLGFVGWGIEEEKKLKSQEALLQKYEVGFKESELIEHRNQMNPHFIFNALNSIQAFILENDIMTAADYLQKFSKLIRGTLNFSKQPLRDVSEIIQFLEAYLNIENLRFSERFEFRLIANNEVRNSTYKIPPLLIQPIIENAIKHAFPPGHSQGQILVRFEHLDNGVYVEVEDNGIGIFYNQKEWGLDHKSIGLDVVKQRLEIMNRQGYETSITFQDLSRVTVGEHGTLVQLLIKTKTYD